MLLHALSSSDRAWLLAKLPLPDRTLVQPLLAELHGLGIPVDRTLLDEVTAPAAASAPKRPAAGDAAGCETRADDRRAQLDRLEHADPAPLAAILRDEPAGLIARLFMMRDWPWRQGVLQQLGERRRHVAEYLARCSAPGSVASKAGPRTAGCAALDGHVVTTLLRRLGGERDAPECGRNPNARDRKKSAGVSLSCGPPRSWLDWFSPRERAL